MTSDRKPDNMTADVSGQSNDALATEDNPSQKDSSNKVETSNHNTDIIDKTHHSQSDSDHIPPSSSDAIPTADSSAIDGNPPHRDVSNKSETSTRNTNTEDKTPHSSCDQIPSSDAIPTTDSASTHSSVAKAAHQLLTRHQLLPHETEQLLQLLEEDALLVNGRGLCAERLLAALLHVCSGSCVGRALVIVLGAGAAEIESVCKLMLALRSQEESAASSAANGNGVYADIHTLTAAETPPAERQRLYAAGGVLFITARILLMDLLTARCPAELVTGVVVYRAHVVVDAAQEAFSLRLFRQKNKTGFIKAISSHAAAFTSGFSQVERVMRSLFVRRLLLWPRFHSQIRESLAAKTPDVVEVQVQLSARMSSIHIALLSLINITVREFRRVNTSLECSELTVECVLSSGFNRVVRARIDPAWHQMSSYAHQLITDLRTLRALLTALLQQDCCSFYRQVAALQSQEASLSSSWSLLDEAETVFIEARCRVFGSEKPQARGAKLERGKARVLKFEVPPKCSVLSEILQEIRTDISNSSRKEQSSSGSSGKEQSSSGVTVFVLARETSTCNFLKRLIRDGCQATLWRRYLGCLAQKFGGSEIYSPHADDTSSNTNTATNTSDSTSRDVSAEGNDEEDLEPHVELQWTPSIRLLFLPLKRPELPFQLRESLERHRPRYVVLYEMDVAAIRTLETYQAWLPHCPLRVYTLLFSGTVEEQSYLTELRVEKEAFEYLIRQKEQMVVPEDREALEEHYEFDDLAPVEDDEENRASTRRGGAAEVRGNRGRPRVIVDTREFRSELPSLLHRRGLVIVPATIEVGDYIITPEVCVERKSISDLVSSLISGRLYTQTGNMVRHYRNPVLLIEFDQNKSFNLQRGLYVSSDVSGQQLVSRLQLLTLHFPQLRLMWCPSPLASAQLLHQLKQNAAEPSLQQARAITTDADSSFAEERYNPQVRNFVSKLPGINAKNLFTILNRINTLADLVKLSKEEMCSLLSKQDGERLHEAIHCRLQPEANLPTASSGKRPASSSRNKQRSTRPRFWKSGK